jgi:hypothetical protein
MFDFGQALAVPDERETPMLEPVGTGRGVYIEVQFPDANSKMTLPYIYMKTADGQSCSVARQSE